MPTGIGSCRWAGLADWQERVAGLPFWTALFLYFCKCAEQDHTRRYGCFLRLHRAARPSRTPGASDRRGLRRTAGCRGDGQLRGPAVRSPFGDLLGAGQATLSRPDLRAGALRCLQGRFAADPRHLPRLYRTRRAALTGRSVSRRFAPPLGDARGPGDQGPHPHRNRAYGFGGHLCQQDAGEDRFGLPQARRIVRDPARQNRHLRRGASRRALFRHRGGHGREDARVGHPHRRRSAAVGGVGIGQAFREGRTQLLRLRPRNRPAPGGSEPHPQISRCRNDLRDRHRRPRGAARRVGTGLRGGVAAAFAPPVPGADRGAEDQVRRFPPDHPFEDASRHGRFARRTAPRRP